MDDMVETAAIKIGRNKLIEEQVKIDEKNDRDVVERKNPQIRRLTQQAEEKIEQVLQGLEKTPKEFLTEEIGLIIKERVNKQKLAEQVKQTYQALEEVHGVPKEILLDDAAVEKIILSLQEAQDKLESCQEIIKPSTEQQ